MADIAVPIWPRCRIGYTCGPRLLKKASVHARVNELQQTIATAAITRALLDREFVIRELMDNALKAKENREWSASNRALELLSADSGGGFGSGAGCVGR